ARVQTIFATVLILCCTSVCIFSQAMSKGIMSPPANVRPPGLKNVGIEQRLNEQIPPQLIFRDETGKTVHLADYFGHRPMILILTPGGRISQYYYGVEFAPKDLRLGLVQASDNKIGTLVDQVLLYCYHYDPATGKYSAIITRIVRLSAIATILGLGVMFLVL